MAEVDKVDKVTELIRVGLNMLGQPVKVSLLLPWLSEVAESLPLSLREAVPMDLPSALIVPLRIGHLMQERERVKREGTNGQAA